MVRYSQYVYHFVDILIAQQQRLLQKNLNHKWIKDAQRSACMYQHSSLKQLEFYLLDSFDCS